MTSLLKSTSIKSYCGIISDTTTDGVFKTGSGNLSGPSFQTTDDEKMAAEGTVNEFTRCVVCSGVYRDPKRLPCFHTFCLRCLEQLPTAVIEGNYEQRREPEMTPGDDGSYTKENRSKIIKCPTCGKLLTVPDVGLEGIPQNAFAIRLLEICQTQLVNDSINSNDDISHDDSQRARLAYFSIGLARSMKDDLIDV